MSSGEMPNPRRDKNKNEGTRLWIEGMLPVWPRLVQNVAEGESVIVTNELYSEACVLACYYAHIQLIFPPMYY